MEKQVFTYVTLKRTELINASVTFTLLGGFNVGYGYFYRSASPLDMWDNLVLYSSALLIIFLYYTMNAVVVLKDGIKTYGLLYKTRFVHWENIKVVGGYAKVQWEYEEIPIKEIAGIKGQKSLYLSSYHPATIDADFLKRTDVIKIPYTPSLYNLIVKRLAQHNAAQNAQ